MCNETKPHPHAALIRAWADGAEIEHYVWETKTWERCEPIWREQMKYRIAPKKKSLGQVAFEAYYEGVSNNYRSLSHDCWERAAQAVLEAHAKEMGWKS